MWIIYDSLYNGYIAIEFVVSIILPSYFIDIIFIYKIIRKINLSMVVIIQNQCANCRFTYRIK